MASIVDDSFKAHTGNDGVDDVFWPQMFFGPKETPNPGRIQKLITLRGQIVDLLA